MLALVTVSTVRQAGARPSDKPGDICKLDVISHVLLLQANPQAIILNQSWAALHSELGYGQQASTWCTSASLSPNSCILQLAICRAPAEEDSEDLGVDLFNDGDEQDGMNSSERFGLEGVDEQQRPRPLMPPGTVEIVALVVLA